jgi:hypothetical protein
MFILSRVKNHGRQAVNSKDGPTFPDAEGVMVKVILKRTIKGQNVGGIARLLRQIRVKAGQHPGQVSGETDSRPLQGLLN